MTLDTSEIAASGIIRESPYMDYRTVDGSKWRCWRTVNKTPQGVLYGFKHAPDGDENRAHEDSIINYYTWGFGKWTARWAGRQGEKFIHTPYGGGADHEDSVLNYVGWADAPDGEYWQARFDPRRNMFIHERFVAK